ncbi:MAG: hypothetical protein LBQ58_10675 [Synergistaceae bacterium]|jgi:tetratricopeptide (TPR) repeat protein|nr:hypothetical protein [Synergistaceae bacterium]
MQDMDDLKIDELIKQVFEEDDDEKRGLLMDKLMDIDPDNPIAKYIKWQSLDDEASVKNLDLLYDAIALLRPQIEITDDLDEVDEDIYSLYVTMLSDLASFLYFSGNKEKAFESAKEFMELDRECYGAARLVYYTILVEQEDFAAVIESAESDICQTPMGEFCRALALFETSDDDDEILDALLTAFAIDPEMAFYILDIWTIDDSEIDSEENDDGYIEEAIMTVAVLAELWSETDDRLSFLTAVTYSFAYITGRLSDPEDIEFIENSYRDIGCLDKMQETRDVLQAMLASGSDQSTIDDEALSILRGSGGLGLFH